ncbi:mucin-17 isoform X2 [Hyalella azteca]|uniref:Mucin-17 isoform X2 n=1 Tax=Hyalella azteca TaxID=294128 RepID=A0A8B7NYA8_HYAAZ|nr:mucin-17 isoform X2 [Hyalella azteca]
MDTPKSASSKIILQKAVTPLLEPSTLKFTTPSKLVVSCNKSTNSFPSSNDSSITSKDNPIAFTSPKVVANAGRAHTENIDPNEGDELEVHFGDALIFSTVKKSLDNSAVKSPTRQRRLSLNRTPCKPSFSSSTIMHRSPSPGELLERPLVHSEHHDELKDNDDENSFQRERSSLQSIVSKPSPTINRRSPSPDDIFERSLLHSISPDDIIERSLLHSVSPDELKRSLTESPRLVSSAALNSEVHISPDASCDDGAVVELNHEMHSGSEEELVRTAMASIRTKSPIKKMREEQEESTPITRKRERSTSPTKSAVKSKTPDSRKKSRSTGFETTPLLEHVKSPSLKNSSPTLKTYPSPKEEQLFKDISNDSVTPSETLDLEIKKEDTSKSSVTSSKVVTPEDSTARRTTRRRRSTSEGPESKMPDAVLAPVATDSIASRTRRRSLSGMSTDDEASAPAQVSGVVGARTRRRSISDAEALTPMKRIVIDTIPEEESDESSGSTVQPNVKPSARRKSLAAKATPQKAPNFGTAAVLLEAAAPSPVLAGRGNRRASLTSTASTSVSTPTRRRSLASSSRAGSVSKELDAESCASPRRVSKMRRLSESPTKGLMVDTKEDATAAVEDSDNTDSDAGVRRTLRRRQPKTYK